MKISARNGDIGDPIEVTSEIITCMVSPQTTCLAKVDLIQVDNQSRFVGSAVSWAVFGVLV